MHLTSHPEVLPHTIREYSLTPTGGFYDMELGQNHPAGPAPMARSGLKMFLTHICTIDKVDFHPYIECDVMM